MALPTEAHQLTSTFLDTIDAAAPGLVEGLHLHGSLGFGEFFPGRSDVDFVAVLSRRPDRTAVAALAAAHQEASRRHPRPPFDGIHLLAADLSRPPAVCPDLPCVLEGVFAETGRSGVNPVTWHELARHSVPVRGSRLTEAQLWTDDATLRAYTYENLTSYWAGVADVLGRSPEHAATPGAAEWCVLGVSRLHHLLTTGTLTSKSGGGRHALTVFGPRWHPIVTEALRSRENPGTPSPYDEDPARRGRDTTAFTTMAIEAALALGA
ncbi:hypothetical protein [Kitasatospora sp. GP82]|uniref:hypothetical protein n=1 Tax=Kitasatospora sp. GP82 TaxID=3035089 RepID=UPI0024754F17|nr:hypothetical protein [Kitasatospora sp. GP82]MDH6124082.1 hypothetical protein [Kitasatospora sp. GP82]